MIPVQLCERAKNNVKMIETENKWIFYLCSCYFVCFSRNPCKKSYAQRLFRFIRLRSICMIGVNVLNILYS